MEGRELSGVPCEEQTETVMSDAAYSSGSSSSGISPTINVVSEIPRSRTCDRIRSLRLVDEPGTSFRISTAFGQRRRTNAKASTITKILLFSTHRRGGEI